MQRSKRGSIASSQGTEADFKGGQFSWKHGADLSVRKTASLDYSEEIKRKMKSLLTQNNMKGPGTGLVNFTN